MELNHQGSEKKKKKEMKRQRQSGCKKKTAKKLEKNRWKIIDKRKEREEKKTSDEEDNELEAVDGLYDSEYDFSDKEDIINIINERSTEWNKITSCFKGKAQDKGEGSSRPEVDDDIEEHDYAEIVKSKEFKSFSSSS